MNSSFKFLKTTLVGGIFVLIPLTIIVVILGKVLVITQKIASPLASRFPEKLGGIGVVLILGLLLLVLICFLAGLISRAAFMKRIMNWIEGNLLSNIPGYAFMKEIGRSVAGVSNDENQKAVVARIEDSWQLGFITEKISDDTFAVYVPGAPNTMSGSLYIMTQDRFKVLDMKPTAVMQILRNLGVNSKEILGGKM